MYDNGIAFALSITKYCCGTNKHTMFYCKKLYHHRDMAMHQCTNFQSVLVGPQSLLGGHLNSKI